MGGRTGRLSGHAVSRDGCAGVAPASSGTVSPGRRCSGSCRPEPDEPDRRRTTNRTIDTHTLNRMPDDLVARDRCACSRRRSGRTCTARRRARTSGRASGATRCSTSSRMPKMARHAERLVQERRLERRVLQCSRPAGARRDLERPRQRGRPPEQLLVEVVAPPADRLREHDAGRDAVHHARASAAGAGA